MSASRRRSARVSDPGAWPTNGLPGETTVVAGAGFTAKRFAYQSRGSRFAHPRNQENTISVP
jgi:hypothetical protein